MATTLYVSLNEMLDKCDVRTETLIPFRREFAEWIAPVENAVRLGHEKLPNGFMRQEHYGAIGSMSEFGIEGYFHGWMRHKRKDGKQTHKIELHDVGQSGRSRIIGDLERIVDVDPNRLELMRIDCAADLPDVPVSFFQHHMRVARKRRGARVTEFEEMSFEHIYGNQGETMYFGKRPNCFRCYDKIAEEKIQLQRSIRKLKKKPADARGFVRAFEVLETPPTLEEAFGHRETDVLTRLERQITGRMVPGKVSIIGQLDNLADYDPFEPVCLYYGADSLPSRYDSRFNFAQYECGIHLRSIQQGFGLDYVHHYMRKHLHKNLDREWKRYLPFFLVNSTSEGISKEQIFETYRASIRRQLAA